MNKYITIVLILLTASASAQDSTQAKLDFRGQLSSWAHLNLNNPYPLYLGGRYLPQSNYEYKLGDNRLIDFEASANLVGDVGIHFFDSAETQGSISPYRIWGRYSTEQLEVRIGLQKIDFGSAMMLRSLRWFDQIDPRDPLALTDGVYGGLVRYYFLNNANVWVWGLYGNKNQKGMEVIKTNKEIPEFGGRFQFPIPLGEMGLSYHKRTADSRQMGDLLPAFDRIPENRVGFDLRWDLIVGLWLEGSWVQAGEDLGPLTNQEIFTVGTDYTFGIGSGLNMTLEHMLFANDTNPFEFSNTFNMSGLAFNYPIGMFDNIRAITYYDWTNNKAYNFLNWFRSFDRTTLYLMGYWNPEQGALPTGGAQNLFGGRGLQIMFVYNH
ncbi:MAG: hypothetical protein JXQ90_08385 [Cyclobacteriaceae bacterium]